MSNIYFEEQIFEKTDFSEKALTVGEYEVCTFINCNFSDSDLSQIGFVDCEFNGCNLSMVKVVKTIFNNVKFKECKMLGVNFENSNEFLFSFDFENCILDFSSFYKRSLKNSKFKNCSLQEADFTESDLSNISFDNCDMTRTKFENTLLEKTDLSTSYNFSIDPEKNRIKKAKFSLTGIAGLLDKYDIVIQ